MHDTHCIGNLLGYVSGLQINKDTKIDTFKNLAPTRRLIKNKVCYHKFDWCQNVSFFESFLYETSLKKINGGL
jgi:hypothetical protein